MAQQGPKGRAKQGPKGRALQRPKGRAQGGHPKDPKLETLEWLQFCIILFDKYKVTTAIYVYIYIYKSIYMYIHMFMFLHVHSCLDHFQIFGYGMSALRVHALRLAAAFTDVGGSGGSRLRGRGRKPSPELWQELETLQKHHASLANCGRPSRSRLCRWPHLMID